MSLLYAKRLFSLDTLDTRFTRSSSVPPAPSGPATPARIDPAKPVPGLDSRDGPSKNRSAQSKGRDELQPSRWATPEFLLYYLVIGIAIPLMVKSVYDISTRERIFFQPKL